jgi:hypothetical protein
LYKEYFLNKNFNINLPKQFISSPTNPLLNEIKNSYPFIDPSVFMTEVSRDFFYYNTDLNKFYLLKNTIEMVNNVFNTSTLTNYLFFYTLGVNSNSNLNDNLDFFKNQYRPIRKGVNNMIRLHATGAVAMPIEIRLHILASSKDVIHS